MASNLIILRYQYCVVGACLGYDQPIERIACPRLIQRVLHNRWKREPAYGQSDFRSQTLDHLKRGNSHTLDFVEELEFENYRG